MLKDIRNFRIGDSIHWYWEKCIVVGNNWEKLTVTMGHNKRLAEPSLQVFDELNEEYLKYNQTKWQLQTKKD